MHLSEVRRIPQSAYFRSFSRAAPPPDHVRPRQEEHFETISGTLRARVGGEERTLRAGERIVVPPSVAHTWWIDGEEEGHVLVEFRPALNTETFFETMYGLTRDGRVGEDGVACRPCCKWR